VVYERPKAPEANPVNLRPTPCSLLSPPFTDTARNRGASGSPSATSSRLWYTPRVSERPDADGRALRSVDILGVRVDDVTEVEALAWAANAIQRGGPHLVVTPNAEFVMRARRERPFRDVLGRADLSIPDGAGLLLAGRILGTPLREQVTGTDLLVGIAGLCATEGWRIYLLGGDDGVAEAAGRSLQARLPGLEVAGAFAGSPRVEDEAGIIARIRSAAPVHVLAVAYGAPSQEQWLARNLPKLDVALGIGIGGALDFISGRVPRAPRWLRRAGLDWLYRLARQPWRWRRQLALPRFVLTALWVRARGGRSNPAGSGTE